MRMLDFWRNVPKRLPSAPLKSIVPLAGRKDHESRPACLRPVSALNAGQRPEAGKHPGESPPCGH